MLNVNITVKAKFSSLPVEQNSSLQIVIFYNYVKEKTWANSSQGSSLKMSSWNCGKIDYLKYPDL